MTQFEPLELQNIFADLDWNDVAKAIVWEVEIYGCSQSDAAKKHGVSKQYVNELISKLRCKNNPVAELERQTLNQLKRKDFPQELGDKIYHALRVLGLFKRKRKHS